MKHILAALLALTLALPAQDSQTIDEKATLAGSSVDAANDFVLVRDASVASGPALKKVTIGDLVNVPSFFSTVPNGTFSIAKVSGLQAALDLKAPLANPAFTGTVTVPDGALTIAKTNGLQTALDGKQATLVSATNIKTINSTSLLGSGDIAINATVDNTSVNAAIATDTIDSANAMRAIGYQSIASSQPSKAWRLYNRAYAKANTSTGSDNARLVAVVHGDSVAQDISDTMWSKFGFGGCNLPITGHPLNAGTVDQFSRTPAGYVVTLTTGQSITVDEQYTRFPFHAVILNYLAKDNNGSLKLEYQTKTFNPNTGAWTLGSFVDADREWSIEQLPRSVQTTSGHNVILVKKQVGLEAGMTVSGTNIAGGTTVSSVGYATEAKTATISSGSEVLTLNSVSGLCPGMYVTSADAEIPVGSRIVSINVGASQVTLWSSTSAATCSATGSGKAVSFSGYRAILSANATGTGTQTVNFGRIDAGSSSGGVLNTDNNSTEKYCTAIINPARAAGPYTNTFFNIKITAVSGPVDVVGLGVSAGGIPHNSYLSNGVYMTGWAQSGKNIGDHFSVTPQDVLTRAAAWLDPDVFTFKTLNNVTESLLQTYWAPMTDKWKLAMPDTCMVIVGTHPYSALPDRSPSQPLMLANDYWRKWCAENDWEFVDIAASYPPARTYATDDDSADDMHAAVDFLHPAEWGTKWGAALVMDKLAPAVDNLYTSSVGGTLTPNSMFRKLPFEVNTIRVGKREPSQTKTDNHFTFTHDGQADKGVFLLTDNHQKNTATFSGYNFGASGLWQFSDIDTGKHSHFQGELGLVSDGILKVAAAAYGMRVAVGASGTTRSPDALEIFPLGNGTGYPTMSIHAQTSQTGAILNLYKGANVYGTTTGDMLWSWMPDGTVVYEGTTADAHEMTLSYTQPTSDVTVTTPAKTGTVGVVPAYADQTAATTAGLVAGDNYWNTTTNSLKTILP